MSGASKNEVAVFRRNPSGSFQVIRGAGRPLTLAFSVQGESGAIPLKATDDGELRGDGTRLRPWLTATPAGTLIDLELTLDPGRIIDFVGFNLGPLELTREDQFFGSKPGFLERDGARSALAAQDAADSTVMVGLVVRRRLPSILVGVGGLHDEPSFFQLVDNRLRAGFEPRRNLTGARRLKLLLRFGDDSLNLLTEYGRFLSAFARPTGAVPTGWNTWDFHAAAVSMDDVEREMDALGRLPFRGDLRYVTLDMGWEDRWGDWRPNRKFPESAAAIAAAVKRRGWTPGIWLAPLQASIFSRVARHHQDLFVTDDDGSLIIDDDDAIEGMLILDHSLPEVRERMGEVFSELRDAGFELFKIDYMYDRYLSRCVGKMGKVAVARAVFETIRHAVGGDAHILNCGGPKEAALGLVDSCRVTIDIHNFWGHVKNNASQIANGFWMNHQLWINDPDFAIIRSAETCSARHRNMPYAKRPSGNDANFWMRGPEASRKELRTWLTAVRLNGGSVFLADSMATLNDAGAADLAKIFTPLSKGFTPLDLFERSHPSIWLSNDERRPTLGLFNWEDVETTLPLPSWLGSSLSGKEVWSGEKLSVNGEISLEPRSCRLVEI